MEKNGASFGRLSTSMKFAAIFDLLNAISKILLNDPHQAAPKGI